MPGRRNRKAPPSPPSLLAKLEKMHPGARTELDFSGPLELLVATILSAQSTDRQVNLVTKGLFRKYRTAADYAGAKTEELEQDIRSTGFFRAKSRLIQGAARMLVERFGGEVPRTLEELTQLPGVARKTANIVLYNAFGKAEGVAVDTHVLRLSRRLGFSEHDNPDKVERDLMALFPRDEWGPLTYRLIEHGRAVCDAKRPVCGQCVLADLCPSAFSVKGWREQA